MTFAKRMRENGAKLLAAGLVLVSLLAPNLAAASTSQPRDCDSNSIVFCGAYTKTEWANKVQRGDTMHSAANIQHIYFSEGRGITLANFQSTKTVDGMVMKDGRVIVNGQVVATGAKSVGRTFMPGSVQSGSVWERPTQTSFAADSIQAWVNMDGGVFHYFILKSCGNAGVATPKATPTPTPIPSKTPTPTPTPTPQASFACLALTPTRPDEKNHPNRFRFTITPKVLNATITGFRFTSTDQTMVATTAANTPFIEKEVKSGSLTVHGQVVTDKGTSELSEQCSATVNVTATKSPTPTPQVLGTSTQILPVTGPETALGGLAGLSAIGFAGRTYLRSRKSLLNALRHKR